MHPLVFSKFDAVLCNATLEHDPLHATFAQYGEMASRTALSRNPKPQLVALPLPIC